MNVSEYLMSQRDVSDWEVINDRTFPFANRVKCADGFEISIQATHGAYCSPRTNIGPWDKVELGFPSAEPNAEIMSYAEDVENPTKTVYGYVPVDAVERLLSEHGGAIYPEQPK